MPSTRGLSQAALVGRVARTELRLARRDRRVLWTGVVLLGLLVGTGVETWSRYTQARVERAAAQRLARNQWLGQRPKDPHAAAHFGTYVFQPVSALAFIDPGVVDHVGVAGFLEAHRRNEFRYRPAAEAPAVAWFGSLTPAALLQHLVPLMFLLWAYGTVAGERESGMLRLLRSAGVTLPGLMLGKLLAMAAIVAIGLVPPAVLATGLLVWAGQGTDLGSALPRVALLGALYGLYWAILLGLALAVSLRARAARTGLVLVLVFWVVNGFIAPRLVGDFVRYLAPMVTPASLARELEAAAAHHDEAGGARGLQAAEEASNRRFDAVYAGWEQDLERQERWLQLGALIAPGLAVRLLSAGLAGTDHAHHRDFAVAAEQYRRAMVRTMNAAFVRSLLTLGTRPVGDATTWATVPDFEYASPPVRWVLRTYAWALTALLVWAFGAWGAVAVACARSID